MGKIRALDDVTISQIAAGEMIDRPASIIKELFENSVDAGATHITIQVQHPTEWIRVTDDGEGFDEEDLPIAFTRHTTSKIQHISDLDTLHTLGFRGEALASIAHVSAMEVITRTKDSPLGTRILVEQGRIVASESVGSPIGTTMIVRDLFENIPVRKKFLKSDQVEFQKILETVQSLSLGYPGIGVLLLRGEKRVFEVFPSESFEDHLAQVLGSDMAGQLFLREYTSASYRIQAFFGKYTLHRSTRKSQAIFLNHRLVRNRELTQAIEKLYQSKIPLHRHPVFFLYIDVDPVLVDVNIHPQKQEVKFSNQNHLIDIITRLFQEEESQGVDAYKWKSSEKKDSPQPVTIFDVFEDASITPTPPLQQEKRSFTPLVAEEQFEYNISEEVEPLPTHYSENIQCLQEEVHPLEDSVVSPRSLWNRVLERALYLGSLFHTYLLFEDGEDQKLLLLDQHAAHERILYEKFLKEFQEGEITRQILLQPEPIHVTPAVVERAQSQKDVFSRLGFEIDAFGEQTILLREIPYFFGEPIALSLLQDLFEALEEGEKLYDRHLYPIMRKACRSAIKGGDHIVEFEVKALVGALLACDHPQTCPHGRPVIVEIEKKEIEKMFLRIGSH